MTDEQLMLRAKEGKDVCLSQLYDRYHTKLYNFFYYRTYDKGQSQDLMQDVFERIVKYRYRYRDQSSFAAWMYTIARNVHKDHYKKKSPSLPGDETIERMKDHPVEVSAEEDERKDRLSRALNLLPPEHREIIWLSRYEGLKYVEIAEVLGSSEGAIKVKVHRIMKELKDIYFKLEDI